MTAMKLREWTTSPLVNQWYCLWKKSCHPVDMENITLWTRFYTSQVVSRISSINSMYYVLLCFFVGVGVRFAAWICTWFHVTRLEDNSKDWYKDYPWVFLKGILRQPVLGIHYLNSSGMLGTLPNLTSSVSHLPPILRNDNSCLFWAVAYLTEAWHLHRVNLGKGFHYLTSRGQGLFSRGYLDFCKFVYFTPDFKTFSGSNSLLLPRCWWEKIPSRSWSPTNSSMEAF